MVDPAGNQQVAASVDHKQRQRVARQVDDGCRGVRAKKPLDGGGTLGNALGSYSFSQTSGTVSATGRSVTMSDGTVLAISRSRKSEAMTAFSRFAGGSI